ncbi:hypothetical protein BDV95DRAFT_609213 [Massariosphaeria phaeospora]|uniref:Uncharacterized protein n=1 Tax=Massariosphaeria phaeospora TaxID=100035 RepID=A0A7C8I5W7_9PLEO|nr:hypothetical protein BDV95DRAFT_609213 [Massariosphaeria phaeospora]
MATMASTNGTLVPPSLPQPPSSPSLAKRKRSGTDAIALNGASNPSSAHLANRSTAPVQPVLEDILAVLKSYDTEPSVLAHPITSSISRASSGESESKRTKLALPGGATITTLIQNGSYDSLEAFEKDVENATTEILASVGTSELPTAQPSLEETRLQATVLAFRKTVRMLVSRETARRACIAGTIEAVDGTVEKDSSNEQLIQLLEEESEGRSVLTLYGSAQGPKQLFSSLQQPQRVAPTNGAVTSSLDTAVKVTLPLRESSLPNIISTTQVFPTSDEANSNKGKKGLTFGEIFRPLPPLPQLGPPKVAKPSTTKGNTITFAHPEPSKPSRRSSYNYAKQSLSTGNWLGYGGVDMPKDPTSPTARQKSRQRALSTGEAQLPPSEVTIAAVKQAKEDALFRSAYSSFAPTRDDATALIPEETKNKVWWQRVGEKRFNDAFPIDPDLLDLDATAKGDANGTADEDECFQEAVENFDPIGIDPSLETAENSDPDKNTEEVLDEISELLETLASHQRIRNSSLATNPHTPVIHNSSLASLAGSPAAPSSEEVDVYQMLKLQLRLMISQLPPYAVAKLNGDQLEELNISRTIIMETKEHRGVLEDDRQSRLEKPQTVPAAAAVPSLSRMASTGSTAHAHYPPSSTQYARATPSAHSTSRPVSTPQSYYPQQQTAHRSPSVHYHQRPLSGAMPGYQAPTSSYASAPRPVYPSSQPYGQQTPRTSYGQTPTGQYYPQRPTQPANYGGAASSQFYPPNPQPQGHSRYPAQQPPNGYYQRTPTVAPMHSYNPVPSPHARTASPLKANPPVAQGNYAPRPAYGTPVSGGQIRSSYYGASQYGTPQPPPATIPPTGYGGLPPSHQQALLERQQAQVTAQAQARLAAQNNLISRQGSGTPQPPPNGGQYGGQHPNGAPMMT